jgi:MOSC domain-containing protein
VRVQRLRVYPVKGTSGVDVQTAHLEPWGLEHDRRWLVVDRDGQALTASTHRRLLLVRATPRPDGGLALSAKGREPIDVRRPSGGQRVPIQISRLDDAETGDTRADAWLTDLLGEPVRLVWLADPRRRTVSPEHGGMPGDVLSFADAGPVLLTTTASLDQLNAWVRDMRLARAEPDHRPLQMDRFRPNVVLDGVGRAFAEDGWKRLQVGAVEFRFAESCDRCVVTTIDPGTLVSGKEPIRTLNEHRRRDGAVYFGVRMIPTVTGPIAVGDAVTVL